MEIFRIDTKGDLRDPELCVLAHAPDGVGVKYARLIDGRSIEADFPADATLRMSEDHAGIKLASLIGNTKRFLIVHRDVKEVIAAEHGRRGSEWPIEYLPFTLLDHKGRPHSRDYLFVNPLGALDCVDHAASDITYFEGDASMVLAINRLVLDEAKLRGAPPIFRLPQAEDRYFVDEALKASLEARGFTNLLFEEVRVEPGASSTP